MSVSRSYVASIDGPVLFSGKTKKCPECKKKFDWLGEQWVYKSKRNGVMQYYCSWTCWRKEDRQKHKPNLRGENCK